MHDVTDDRQTDRRSYRETVAIGEIACTRAISPINKTRRLLITPADEIGQVDFFLHLFCFRVKNPYKTDWQTDEHNR